MSELTDPSIWKLLEEVKDPEIPVVSVVEMGIVRQVGVEAGRVSVRMTPTFSGCPALQVIRDEIRRVLLGAGAVQVDIEVVLAPAWTSDWITPAARQKLKDFGLAPPPQAASRITIDDLLPVACPWCGSQDTSLKNSFGPTLCRAIFVCNTCRQPFEQFKPI